MPMPDSVVKLVEDMWKTEIKAGGYAGRSGTGGLVVAMSGGPRPARPAVGP